MKTLAHRIPVPRAAAGALTLTALLLTSCSFSGLRKPATPEPHAFISYKAPAPGDTNLRLAVKDLIDMKGEVTSAGSEYLYKNAPPATKDAECMKYIRGRRDVTIVGKANLSEFAIGVSGSNDYFGTPVNPVDKSRVPGGSSSGSAVAVAMNLADVALGTDTAGSIRVPACCCGIAGLKTTFGRISTKGVYPISPKYLDTVGPLARDVDGLVNGMELLEPGFQNEYARAKAANPLAKTIRIGRLRVPGTDPAIDDAIDRQLAAAGFTVIPLSAEFHEEWAKAQHDGNLVAAAASYYNNDQIRKHKGVGNRASKAILFGDLVFSRKYDDEAKREAAIARRDHWRDVLRQTFKRVDAIALPVLQRAPYHRNVAFTAIFEAKFIKIQNTVAVNYAGVPAVAIPVPLHKSGAFPVTSVQFVGPANSEAALLNIGRLAEKRS
ncbi:Asp-tRNA(Asn)/Glu-tRNA(Gln) amidotransferase A subunit family amidase [Roseimicrobium gellanilyticum]|uniref:Asp-tRNA(Asn)/Glu-tRNA(Gln) amidotransferase A subunit family amidase n=1 Tax=Roseimicrobium gellanilyticum TaxID=748857 RepID=A0A366HUE4_9BACT|nr:amidase [Roseimicrobium gellanilyticum]RBP46553.1 Asp-tRNA(Asn)/Glu-tRNA(Gln) amidotransferase A subunit family amidase [Roseimicrobium gellanilyticum]